MTREFAPIMQLEATFAPFKSTSHAHYDIVFHFTAMKYHIMPYCYVFTYGARYSKVCMNRRVVLDIAIFPYLYFSTSPLKKTARTIHSHLRQVRHFLLYLHFLLQKNHPLKLQVFFSQVINHFNSLLLRKNISAIFLIFFLKFYYTFFQTFYHFLILIFPLLSPACF